MADRAISSRSPLAALATPGRRGAAMPDPGVRIREVTDFAAIGLTARRGKIGAVTAVLSRHLGSPVADGARRTSGGALAIAGTAPGQWLAVGRGRGAAAQLAAVRADLAGLAAVTDQGDGRVILDVAGPRARDALAKGIAIDLDAIAFHVGDTAQTIVAHIGLQIALIDAAPTFELISARSTAESLWSWLVASAAEYGIEVH
ncbi:MAG: sarcosine oxidase subunit gamma [Hyphomicrobiaceae bacterium]